MATWAMVGGALEALRGSEPGTLHGAACWRVDGKVIVQLGPRLRVPDEDEIRAANGELIMVAVSKDQRDELLHEDPSVFFMTPHYMTSNLVLVWLDKIDRTRLRELLTDSWRFRAPKRLVRGFDAAL